MIEGVRLLIWDLDETFWQGTLTEGGHVYRQDTHAIVLELASRGIMSSICSKNDHAAVEAILRATGIWDCFVFPSIDWTAKGPRIRSLIQAVGLRAPTVMLIDDNPMNLNEALHFVPDMQVAPHSLIPDILGSPLFAGKPDPQRTRLAQYKTLERRQAGAASAGGDNRAFLRGSGVRVRIDHEFDAHIDRVIELINRTNQLNFTKRRLPENQGQARAIIRDMAPFVIQAGLVHVQDRYGDYGYCGFYAVNAMTQQMIHFCFSCRILNMGVERWLYDRLGRPAIDVQGEVLTDLSAPADPIDWINADEPGAAAPAQPTFAAAMLRGGCELQAVAHYLGLATETVQGEYFEFRHGLPIRIDHTIFLRYAMDGVDPAMLAAVAPLGYTAADFQSRLLTDAASADFFLFSFWRNACHALYRHRTLGFTIPFTVPNADNALNVFETPAAVLDTVLTEPFARAAIEHLRRHFDFTGVPPGSSLQDDITRLLDQLPAGKPVFVLLLQEHLGGAFGPGAPIPHHIWTNDYVRAACAHRPHVFLLRIEDHLEAASDAIDAVHFTRQVYYRLHRTILQQAAALQARTGQGTVRALAETTA